MKIGDQVRITKIPRELPDDDLGTRQLFELCLGRVFPIVGFQGELVELDVGEVLGQPDYMHAIWIEREFVQIIEASD